MGSKISHRVKKKIFVFKLANSHTVRTVKVKAHSIAEAKEKLKNGHGKEKILEVVILDNSR